MKYERICPMCGKQFTTNRSSQRMCSPECTYNYNDLHIKSTPLRQKCKVCGKVFSKAYLSPFCSNECRAAFTNKPKKKKKDNLDKVLNYCSRMGIDYAEYQKLSTLSKINPILEQGESDDSN